MSLELVHDQEILYKNAKPLVTDMTRIDNDDFEFIQIEKSKTPEQIRKAFMRQNLDPLDKAMEKGADYVRDFFNAKNLRKRKGAVQN